MPQVPPVEVFQALEKAELIENAASLIETHALYNAVLQLTAACQNETVKVESWGDGFVELLTRTTNFPSLEMLQDELAQRQENVAKRFDEFIN